MLATIVYLVYLLLSVVAKWSLLSLALHGRGALLVTALWARSEDTPMDTAKEFGL